MRTGMRVGGEVKECRGGLSVRPYPKNPEKTVELCIRNPRSRPRPGGADRCRTIHRFPELANTYTNNRL